LARFPLRRKKRKSQRGESATRNDRKIADRKISQGRIGQHLPVNDLPVAVAERLGQKAEKCWLTLFVLFVVAVFDRAA
jgi:hypothetical protein